MNINTIKSELRKLKKLRKQLRVGSPERKDINKKMKNLKTELEALTNPSDEKQVVIDKLTALYKKRRHPIVCDFRNYTVEQLKIHLERFRNGGGLYG